MNSLTLDETAKMLGCSTRTVRNLLKKGDLVATPTGKTRVQNNEKLQRQISERAPGSLLTDALKQAQALTKELDAARQQLAALSKAVRALAKAVEARPTTSAPAPRRVPRAQSQPAADQSRPAHPTTAKAPRAPSRPRPAR